MSIELTSDELSELFIHGFKPISTEERSSLFQRWVRDNRGQHYCALPIRRLLAALRDEGGFFFFKKEMPKKADYYLYIEKTSMLTYWYLAKAKHGKLDKLIGVTNRLMNALERVVSETE